MRISRRLLLLSLPFLLLTSVTPCQANDYPSKPIRIIVPFPPGGTTDIMARLVGQKLTEAWKQQVVVDNRAGAGGLIGTDMVAKAQPDGYTLVMGTIGTHATNMSLTKKMPYDTLKDFAPVAHVGNGTLVLVVHNSLPVKSLKELIAYAKANPGKLNYATGGIGSSQHLPMELLRVMAGIEMVAIHYKGGAPAILDVLGGRVPLIINQPQMMLDPIRSGQLRALAVGDTSRSPLLPDVPTAAEAGLEGYQAAAWQALFAPARTPKDIVAKLNREINKIFSMPEVKGRVAALGVKTPGGAPEDLRRFQEAEVKRWAKIIKEGNITID